MAKPNDRPEVVQMRSPKGPLRFPKLNSPDYGNDKYPSPQGRYSAPMVFKTGSAEAEEMIAGIAPHHAAAIQAAQEAFAALPKAKAEKLKAKKITGPVENPFYEELLDKETGEPTGEILFKISRDASGTYKTGPKEGKKWTRTPTIFDAQTNRLENPPEIWSGTKAKTSFKIVPYLIDGTWAAGVSLRMVAVQILDLVTAGGGVSAESAGFEAEAGYEASDEAIKGAAPVADQEDSDDDDDGTGNF